MRNPHNDPLVSAETGTAKEAAASPERRCVLTGRVAPREELLRLALSPEGLVLPDVLARAPGRGAWIGVSQQELREAVQSGALRGALARSFKSGALEIPEDLADLAETGFRRAITQRLGLELRTGRLILGAERISTDARAGKVAALYHASDASEGGARKLDQAWRVGQDVEGSGLVGLWLPLDRMTLSVALGRQNVVHIGICDDRAAKRIQDPLGRLIAFLQASPAQDNSTAPDGEIAVPEPVSTI